MGVARSLAEQGKLFPNAERASQKELVQRKQAYLRLWACGGGWFLEEMRKRSSINSQLKNKANDFEWFSLGLDESKNVTDTAQLSVQESRPIKETEKLASVNNPLHYRWEYF